MNQSDDEAKSLSRCQVRENARKRSQLVGWNLNKFTLTRCSTYAKPKQAFINHVQRSNQSKEIVVFSTDQMQSPTN